MMNWNTTLSLGVPHTSESDPPYPFTWFHGVDPRRDNHKLMESYSGWPGLIELDTTA